MLVSVHLPKTAGSSFRESLLNYYGSHFYFDQVDFPINHSGFKRKGNALSCAFQNTFSDRKDIACIHGQFMPVKYLPLKFRKKAIFVTWLRDPVERLASHYYYWKRAYNPNDPKNFQPLHRRVVEEDWSFERFCFSPQLRNFYTQFLWGFPFSFFTFIGITEHFEEDFHYFIQTFIPDLKPTVHYLNQNPSKEGNRYVLDGKLRCEIEAYHAQDMQLYRQALEIQRLRKIPGSKVELNSK